MLYTNPRVDTEARHTARGQMLARRGMQSEPVAV